VHAHLELLVDLDDDLRERGRPARGGAAERDAGRRARVRDRPERVVRPGGPGGRRVVARPRGRAAVEEVGHARVRAQRPERARGAAPARRREGRAEYARELGVQLGEDVDEREQRLVVVECERLGTGQKKTVAR
jgi:hypothetical protein